MGNNETLNKKQIFDNFKEQLADFKNILEKQQDDKKIDIQSYETSFYNGLVDLYDKVDDEDKDSFSKILEKLKNHEITVFDLNKLGEILIKLEQKDINQAELEKMKKSIFELRKIKGELNQLQTNISSKENPLEKELKEKIEKYKRKISSLEQEHPIWIKAMILLLPSKLSGLFFKGVFTKNNSKKITEKDKEKKHDSKSETTNKRVGEKDNNLFSKLTNTFDSIAESFNKIGDFFADMIDEVADFFSKGLELIKIRFAMMFFFVPWIGAPKEIKELFTEISELKNVDVNILKKYGGAFSDVTKGLTELSPEKLEQGKKQLLAYMKKKGGEWFGITPDKEKKYQVVLEKWWEKISSDSQIHKFIEKIVDGKVKLEDMTLSDILSGLGAGLKGSIYLVNYLHEEGLIDFRQIGLGIVKKGLGFFVQTALFFPKAVYTVLGGGKLEDLYEYIKNGEFADVNKDMFLVMIYRAINTPPFSILQHIAALPGYALKTVANMGQTYTKGKIFFEALNGKIDTQLKLLSEIEQQITGRQGKIYEGILESLQYYKKGLVVSYAFGSAKDFNEFKNIIKEAGLAEDDRIKVLLKELENSYDVTKITAFIDSMKVEIADIGSSSEYASSTELMEKLKKEVGGIFGHTNFFKETVDKLATSLEKNANILKQAQVLQAVERIFSKKIHYAKAAASLVELLDLSHLTGDVDSLKKFGEDLRILAKYSPDLLKFVFRNIPVVLLSDEIIKKIKNGDPAVSAVLKTYMEFVPIVGPIVFISDKILSNKAGLTDIGVSGVWLGLDFWYVFKANPGGILKLLAMPAVDTAKFIGNATDILGRYLPKSGKFVKEIKIAKSWRFAPAAVALAIMFGIYKYVKSDVDIANQQAFKILKDVASKDVGLANEEIVSKWNNWNEDLQKQLLTAFVFYYLGLDPETMKELIKDVKYDGKKYVLELAGQAKNGKNYLFIKDKLAEIEPVLNTMEKKLNVNIEVSVV